MKKYFEIPDKYKNLVFRKIESKDKPFLHNNVAFAHTCDPKEVSYACGKEEDPNNISPKYIVYVVGVFSKEVLEGKYMDPYALVSWAMNSYLNKVLDYPPYSDEGANFLARTDFFDEQGNSVMIEVTDDTYTIDVGEII